MQIEIPSIDYFKKTARRLKKALKRRHQIELKTTESQELLARVVGFRNLNELQTANRDSFTSLNRDGGAPEIAVAFGRAKILSTLLQLDIHKCQELVEAIFTRTRIPVVGGEWKISPGLEMWADFESKGNYISTEFNKTITFTEGDSSSKPLEPFKYAMVDVKKWDRWWQSSDIFDYLPRNLEDLPDFLKQDPLKAATRFGRIKQKIAEHGEFNSIVVRSAKGMEHPRVDDGRHRFWIARDLQMSAICVVCTEPDFRTLERMNLLAKIKSEK